MSYNKIIVTREKYLTVKNSNNKILSGQNLSMRLVTMSNVMKEQESNNSSLIKWIWASFRIYKILMALISHNSNILIDFLLFKMLIKANMMWSKVILKRIITTVTFQLQSCISVQSAKQSLPKYGYTIRRHMLQRNFWPNFGSQNAENSKLLCDGVLYLINANYEADIISGDQQRIENR